PIPPGGFLVALKDSNGDGRADAIERFGETVASGGHGGAGLGVYNGYVFSGVKEKIVRYKLMPGQRAPKGQGETIVSGMPITGDHPMHPFAITGKGELLFDVGSASNACEQKNRYPHSRGFDPCTEKETRAGIWRYDADKIGQKFSAAARF